MDALGKIRDELQAAVSEQTTPRIGRGRVVLVNVPPGVGKTYLASCLAKGLQREGRRVAYAGGTHKLVEEFSTLARRQGAPAVVLQGAQTTETCRKPTERAEAMKHHPDGHTRVCGGCPEKGRCKVHTSRRAAASEPSALRIGTLAEWQLNHDERSAAGRVVFLDEALDGLAVRVAGLHMANLQALARDGIKVKPALERLFNESLIPASHRAPLHAGACLDELLDIANKDGETLQLSDLLEVDLAIATYAAGENRITRGALAPDPGDWHALASLRELARRGALGQCWIRQGELRIPDWRGVPQPQPNEVFIVLDASADPQIIAALFPDADLVLVTAEAPCRPTLYHWQTSRGVAPDGASGRAAAHLAAALACRPRTVAFAPSKVTRDPDHPLTRAPNLHYHASSAARGVNDFEACDSIVLLPHHVPVADKRIIAGELAARRTGKRRLDHVEVTASGRRSKTTTLPPLTDGAAFGVVARALEDATLYQEAHRIRGAVNEGRTIHLVGGEIPKALSEECEVHIIPDAQTQLAGWIVGDGALLKKGWSLGAEVAAAALRAAVEAHEGVWCPQMQPWTTTDAKHHLSRPETALGLLRGLRIICDSPCSLVDELGDNWTRFATRSGLHLAELESPKGKLTSVWAAAPSPDEISQLQEHHWPEWGALRRDPGAMVRAAFKRGVARSQEAVAADLGVTRQRLRGALKHAGLDWKALVGESLSPQEHTLGLSDHPTKPSKPSPASSQSAPPTPDVRPGEAPQNPSALETSPAPLAPFHLKTAPPTPESQRSESQTLEVFLSPGQVNTSGWRLSEGEAGRARWYAARAGRTELELLDVARATGLPSSLAKERWMHALARMDRGGGGPQWLH